MTELTLVQAEESTGPSREMESLTRMVLRRFLRHKMALVSLMVLALVILSAVLAPAQPLFANGAKPQEQPATTFSRSLVWH